MLDKKLPTEWTRHLGQDCTNAPMLRCLVREATVEILRVDCFISGHAELYEETVLHRFERGAASSELLRQAVVEHFGPDAWEALLAL